jgi:putative protease
VKNKFAVGDQLELIHPSGNRIVALAAMTNLDGVNMDVAPGVGHTVRVPLAAEMSGAMVTRLL